MWLIERRSCLFDLVLFHLLLCRKVLVCICMCVFMKFACRGVCVYMSVWVFMFNSLTLSIIINVFQQFYSTAVFAFRWWPCSTELFVWLLPLLWWFCIKLCMNWQQPETPLLFKSCFRAESKNMLKKRFSIWENIHIQSDGEIYISSVSVSCQVKVPKNFSLISPLLLNWRIYSSITASKYSSFSGHL